MADRAYGYRDELLEQSDKDRPAVVRISSRTFPCQTSDGTPFNIAEWLREQKGNRASCWVFITGGKRNGAGKRIAVRLVAQRLSGAARQREVEHAKQQASKHGHPLSEATEEECEWILIATTETSRWSDEEVLLLYRARLSHRATLQAHEIAGSSCPFAHQNPRELGGLSLCLVYLLAPTRRGSTATARGVYIVCHRFASSRRMKNP